MTLFIPPSGFRQINHRFNYFAMIYLLIIELFEADKSLNFNVHKF